MMSFYRIGILLKKRVMQMLSFAKKGRRGFDFLGLLFSLAFSVAMIFIVVYVFKAFFDMYLNIRILGVQDFEKRKIEILTVLLFIVLIVGTVSAVSFINFSLFESDDLKILIALPFKPIEIVLSKLVEAYVKQVIMNAVILLPICIAFTKITSFNGAFIPLIILFCFLIPVLSIALAGLFSPLVYLVSRFIQKRFVLRFVAITAVFAIFFFFYSGFLRLLEQILVMGEIRSFFNISLMQVIGRVVRIMYPAVLFVNLIFGIKVSLSIAFLVLILILSMGASFVLYRYLFIYAAQDKLSGGQNNRYSDRIHFSRRASFFSLILKEFNQIFRTPSYSFQYFSTALTMPLAVYFCVSIGASFVQSSLNANINFELSLIITALFGVLTNTFCATNISREGAMFICIKGMPLSVNKIIYAKVVFCLIVAMLSNLICAVVLGAFGFIGFSEAVFIFIIGSALGYAQICFATRKDFNNPTFSSDDDSQIRESNKTVSTVLFTGLVSVLLLSLAVLYFSLYSSFSTQSLNGHIISIILCGSVAALFSVLSTLYLNRGLNERYRGVE